jgi:hypothetical protein
MFNGGRRGARPAAGAAPVTPAPEIFKYKIEVSMDGNTFTPALDQSKNSIAKNTIFEEIPPVKCRFVRLTLTGWPKTTPLGILEFTVFGKPADSLPAQQPIPGKL